MARSSMPLVLATVLLGCGLALGQPGSGSGSGMAPGLFDCMSPVADLATSSKELVGDCLSTLEGSSCEVGCAAGFRADRDLPAGETAFAIVCDAAGWRSAPNLDFKCGEFDACSSSPCVPVFSVCEDKPAPSEEYECLCASQAGGTPDPLTGEGCSPPLVKTSTGNLVLQVGTGQDIFFNAGVGSGAGAKQTSVKSLLSDFDDVDTAIESLDIRVSMEIQNLAGDLTTVNASLLAEIMKLDMDSEQARTDLLALLRRERGTAVNTLELKDAALDGADQLLRKDLNTLTGRVTTAESGLGTAQMERDSLDKQIVDGLASKQANIDAVNAKVIKLDQDVIDFSASNTDQHAVTRGQATVLQGEVDTLDARVGSEVSRLEGLVAASNANALNAIGAASAQDRRVAQADAAQLVSQQNIPGLRDSVLANTDGVAQARSLAVNAAASATNNKNSISTLQRALSGYFLLSKATAMAACYNRKGVFDVNNNRCTSTIGAVPGNPAVSCRQLFDLGIRSNGVYYLARGGVIDRAFCLQTENGGGWELLISVDGSSSTFQYASSLWTSSTSLLSHTSFNNGAFGLNRKYSGFNVGHYTTLFTKWRTNTGQQFSWPNPSGFNSQFTPQRYFTTSRTIRNGRTSTVTSSTEFRNARGAFSAQTCAARLAIAQCTAGHACARWGFHWNNECSFGSNDAGGGLGTKPNAQVRAAGDWSSCCCSPCGRRNNFDVLMYGRI